MTEAIKTICVVGLGYVGLPLAVELSKHFNVIGFDVNQERIARLNNCSDDISEVDTALLKSESIIFTSDPQQIVKAQVIIACVPTPIDEQNKPDLSCLTSVSQTIGEHMSKGSIVVYESTVYPGVTEDICVPILEKYSGMKCKEGFKVGYSPERINPGDKEHTINRVTKIVSGIDGESLSAIDYVYSRVTTTHKAPSIKVAEGAKVIENIQRDLNIALMNELAMIFDKMNINVYDVLEAAGTKWNFHKYHPGLVGGHCIGVDPYYLTHKAEELGYTPEVILAGRKINDQMHQHYSSKIFQILESTAEINQGKKVLLLGLTFKPNVNDFRNSRVKHLIKELQQKGVDVFAYDPFLSKDIIEKHFHAKYLDPYQDKIDAHLIVKTTEHDKLKNWSKDFGREVLTLKNL